MKKWARIEEGVVREITDIDPEGRFHPSLIWAECEPETVVGYTYSDGEFVSPKEPEMGYQN